MEKVLTKTQELTKLLRTSKHLRDNDLQLIVKVWAMESGISENNPVFKKLVTGSLTSPDSITRTKRKIQQHNPSLRGKTYNARQARAKAIRKEIVK